MKPPVMLRKLFQRLFGIDKDRGDAASRDFDTLNRQAPLIGRTHQVAQSTPASPLEGKAGFIGREAMLGRDHRVAAYQFMLHQPTRDRLRRRSRRIHHVYAEVLVRNVLKLDVARLLGHRKAFLDLPDTFLRHPSISELPPASTVLLINPIEDQGALTAEELLATVKRLREAGFSIALDARHALGNMAFLAEECDYLIVHADSIDPEATRKLVGGLRSTRGAANLVARDVATQDDFLFCFGLGAKLFQGPFITRREDWSGNTIGPNTARIAALLARVRNEEVDIREIAQTLQRDPALSLRLMRYINSASIGMREQIDSIERALLLLGREKLYRWLMLLIYSADKGSERSAALLENALVRARMMELLGQDLPEHTRDAMFLVGLLSLVDAMLQVPIDKAMASLGLAPEIEAAVVRGEGPMAKTLALVVSFEADNPDNLTQLAAQCGIDPEMASECHFQALAWAMEVAD